MLDSKGLFSHNMAGALVLSRYFVFHKWSLVMRVRVLW